MMLVDFLVVLHHPQEFPALQGRFLTALSLALLSEEVSLSTSFLLLPRLLLEVIHL